MNVKSREIVVEVLLSTLLLLLVIRVIVMFGVGVLWDLPLALIPVLFMWVPVWILSRKHIDPDKYPLAIPPFHDRAVWWTALRWGGGLALLATPCFVVGYHLWQTWLFPQVLDAMCHRGVPHTCGLAFQMQLVQPMWRWDGGAFALALLRLVAYHLLFVAIPEELYYRGYVQSRLDEAWPARRQLAGASVGWAWPVTCLIFALGHSVVAFQWWHIFIVFPALIFGWLRARTGHVLAGAFFHGFCNVLVGVLDMIYGLSPL